MSSEWRKSTYSQPSGGNCVEVASDGDVYVRDTQNRDGGTLIISPQSWARFVASIRQKRS